MQVTSNGIRPGNRVKATRPNPMLPSYAELLDAEGTAVRVETHDGDTFVDVRFDAGDLMITMHESELERA